MIKVEVKNRDSLEFAIKKLRKLLEKEGVIKEMRKHAYYEKPSEQRRRRLRRAIAKSRDLEQGQ